MSTHRRAVTAPATVLVQVRVGTTLLTTTVTGPRGGGLGDAEIRGLAEMLAERARQAQSGDDPSAGPPD